MSNQGIQFHVYAPTATKEITQAQIVIQHYIISDRETICVPILTANPTEGDNRSIKSFPECGTSLLEYYTSITSPISFGITAECSLNNSFTHPSNAYQNRHDKHEPDLKIIIQPNRHKRTKRTTSDQEQLSVLSKMVNHVLARL